MSAAPGDEYAGVRSAYGAPVRAQSVDADARLSPVAQWPFWAVMLAVVASFVAVVLGDVGAGLAGFAVALSLAAALRVTLPHRMAGWLIGRSRATDASVLMALALGLGFVSRMM
jgi:hypothetical protein